MLLAAVQAFDRQQPRLKGLNGLKELNKLNRFQSACFNRFNQLTI